jgi:hypothetical protein
MTEPAAKPKRRRINDPRNHIPTEQTRAAVWMMAATGVALDNIARAMGVHKATISRHYKEELSRGTLEANNKVAASLFKIATGTSPQAMAACAFWLKTRARWQEVHKVEVGAEGGGVGGALIVYSGCLAAHDKEI